MRFPVVLAAIAATVIASGTARAWDIGLVSQTSNDIAGHSNFDLAGYEFQTSAAVNVTELGMFVSGGTLADSHFVGLYTASGTLLTSLTLDSGSAKDASGYAYASLASPYALGAGTYFIGAYYNQSSPDEMYDGFGSVTMAPGMSYVGADVYYGSSGFDPTNPTTQPQFTEGSPRAAYFGPNLQFQPVPEPSSLIMVGLVTTLAVTSRLRARHRRRSCAAPAVRG